MMKFTDKLSEKLDKLDQLRRQELQQAKEAKEAKKATVGPVLFNTPKAMEKSLKESIKPPKTPRAPEESHLPAPPPKLPKK